MHILDKGTRGKVLGLRVRCSKDGCDWEGELGDLERHLSSGNCKASEHDESLQLKFENFQRQLTQQYRQLQQQLQQQLARQESKIKLLQQCVKGNDYLKTRNISGHWVYLITGLDYLTGPLD